MADTSYGTKVYLKAPGDELVIPSGCALVREDGARITLNSTALGAGSLAAIATTYTTSTLSSVATSDANTTAGILNNVLQTLRNIGVIAT